MGPIDSTCKVCFLKETRFKKKWLTILSLNVVSVLIIATTNYWCSKPLLKIFHIKDTMKDLKGFLHHIILYVSLYIA